MLAPYKVLRLGQARPNMLIYTKLVMTMTHLRRQILPIYLSASPPPPPPPPVTPFLRYDMCTTIAQNGFIYNS